MATYIVNGGIRLSGGARVHGAKNSVLPILAATLLARGESVIEDCPQLSDVECTLRILKSLGCQTAQDGERVTVSADRLTGNTISDSLMREMRSSVIFLGAVLARQGCAVMSRPGGCELGSRPIDLHIDALRELGATITDTGALIYCDAARLVGKDITLALPSVGATENIMLAATAAEGITRIHNPAREPEIVDLQDFLCAMGAKVSGAGGSLIIIEGGHQLHSARYRIIPDRIVTATYMAAVAAAGGEAVIENVRLEQVRAVSNVLREAGCEIEEGCNSLFIRRRGELQAVSQIRTQPYPGFPTDAQSVIMSVMASAKGTTLFTENIFENRFRHAGELMRMGADIKVAGKVAVVTGVPRLSGAEVQATDLRGGAGLVVAGLGAAGTTRVYSNNHVERGYFGLDSVLSALGADIRVED